MTIIFVAASALFLLGLTVAIGQYRRHRARPAVHHFMMANHLWQPRKLD